MDEKEIFLFGINPVLEALKVSPNDICEILIGKGSSAPALRGVEGGRSGINIQETTKQLLKAQLEPSL